MEADEPIPRPSSTVVFVRPAAEILKARKNKAMKVPYPTRKTLKRLAKFDATSPMLEWARASGEKGVICDQPAFSPDEFA
jgi:hypothetical protein